ncbi:hypothetical protein FHW88_005048 [Mucilaginibacter sp. SG538B]|nr:hypothetical protein [Mucilaginibacter sp. SG538B]NVM66730.1 hypothetical protein [Mucilaginibacter sp. SG538B]
MEKFTELIADKAPDVGSVQETDGLRDFLKKYYPALKGATYMLAADTKQV